MELCHVFKEGVLLDALVSSYTSWRESRGDAADLSSLPSITGPLLRVFGFFEGLWFGSVVCS